MSTVPYDERYVTFGDDFVEVRWREDYNLVGKSHVPLDLDTETWWHLFTNLSIKHKDNKCIGWREKIDEKTLSDYKWLSFEQTYAICERIANALCALGVKRNENVGLFAPNRIEWLIADFAMQRQGIVSVPLYATFGKASIVYIMNHSELKTVFCSKEMIAIIIDSLPELKFLSRLICFDNAELPEDQAKVLKDHNIEYLIWSECEALGGKHNYPAADLKPSDTYSIIYTSGTTGNPKGVVHTQRSVLAAIEIVTFYSMFENGLTGASILCYLPLAHVYSRVLAMAYIRGGACVGMFSGSVRFLFDDIAALNPTDTPCVPRVLKKMYDKIQDTVASTPPLQKKIFNLALSSKLGALENKTTTFINWDSFVFKKTKAIMGNRCRFVLSASAPLDTVMVPYLSAVLCTPINQAYGLTETFGGVCATNQVVNTAFTSTGILLYGESFRLVDVPEMGYFVHDNPPRGEILIKGNSNFKCYYKEPEITAEVLDKDGWMKTGDIAELDLRTESFTIIDRKKNIFKMAQGEFVSAERVEAIIARNNLIENIWLQVEMGDSFTVAVVVPNFEKLRIEADKLGISYKTDEDLTKNAEIKKFILKSIREKGLQEGAQSYELPQAIYLEPENFTEANDMMTPSFKLRRDKLKKKYAGTIVELRKEAKIAIREHEEQMRAAAAAKAAAAKESSKGTQQ